MTMLVFSMNMAGGDNRGVLNVASFTCPPVPLMSGHLSCTDTFAWSRACPFMAGTTVQQALNLTNLREVPLSKLELKRKV